MTFIPFKALKIGALTPFKEPIKYSKARLSGSKKITYILHCRSGMMPGQLKLFSINHLKNPKLNCPLNNNSHIQSFKLMQLKSEKIRKGPFYHENISNEFLVWFFYNTWPTF